MKRTTHSSGTGDYMFSDLDPGSYVVSVEANGFKRATNPAVTISVKARVEVDPRLEVGAGTGMDQTQTYYWNLHWDYGLLSYDTTNRWVTSFVYQVPSRSSGSAFSRALLSGWQTSGIVTLRSGFPFTVNAPGAVSNLGGFGGTGNRPNVVGDPSAPVGGQSILHWFNMSAFQIPAPYTLGDEGKNILRGPGLAQLDLAVHRRIALPWDGHHLIIRMEAANLLDRPQLGLPNASFGVSSFGVIQSLGFGAVPRQLQTVLRYEF